MGGGIGWWCITPGGGGGGGSIGGPATAGRYDGIGGGGYEGTMGTAGGGGGGGGGGAPSTGPNICGGTPSTGMPSAFTEARPRPGNATIAGATVAGVVTVVY